MIVGCAGKQFTVLPICEALRELTADMQSWKKVFFVIWIMTLTVFFTCQYWISMALGVIVFGKFLLEVSFHLGITFPCYLACVQRQRCFRGPVRHYLGRIVRLMFKVLCCVTGVCWFCPAFITSVIGRWFGCCPVAWVGHPRAQNRPPVPLVSLPLADEAFRRQAHTDAVETVIAIETQDAVVVKDFTVKVPAVQDHTVEDLDVEDPIVGPGTMGHVLPMTWPSNGEQDSKEDEKTNEQLNTYRQHHDHGYNTKEQWFTDDQDFEV